MSADEFQEIWKAYDAKLEKSLKLNRQLLEEVGSGKVRTSFNWLIATKAFGFVWTVAWMIFCGNMAWRFRTEPVFVVSAIGMIAFCVFGMVAYIIQLLIIAKINLSRNILDTQELLAHLETWIIKTYRILILQAPLYSYFFITRKMMASMPVGYWIFQGCFTALTIVGVIWLYRNITAGNMHKTWVRKLMNNEGWKSIDRARAFIREIEEFRKEA